jgi:hypothetical protein
MTEQEIVTELCDDWGWSRSVRTGSLRITAPMVELDGQEERLIEQLAALPGWHNRTERDIPAVLERTA